MAFKPLLKLLAGYWWVVLVAVLSAGGGCYLGALVGEARQAGLLADERRRNSGLQQQLTDAERQRREAAQQHVTALTGAVQQLHEQQALAQRLTAELMEVQDVLARSKTEQRARNKNAVKNDAGFNGIGPDSLREYRRALGYGDGAGHR